MKSVANASVNAIQKFKDENSNLEYILNELRSAAFNAISRLKAECEDKLKEYEQMADEAAELVSKARNSQDSESKPNMVAKAENLCAFFRSQSINIQQMIKTLDGLDSTVYPMIDKALDMVQTANGGLQAAINAINEYVSFSLR